MKTYQSSGLQVSVTALAAATSGEGMLIGSLFGVAQADAAIGETVALVTEGIIEHGKTSAQAWSVGDKIYWNDSTKKMTTADSGNTLVGVAVAAAANPSSTGVVRLDGAVR